MDELFAKRLKQLKKESKLTYEELAKELGFKSRSTICKYANGQISNIGPSGIAKIANFFQVSPSWLAGFTDDRYYNMKK